MDNESKNKGNGRPITLKAAKLKIAEYCAYQERTQQQVRDKLYGYGLYKDEVEELISQLIVEGFLNEERFAISYAGGKFRMKKWGKVKITQGLKQHRVSDYCIKKALKEISNEDYYSTLTALAEKKWETEKETNPFKKKNKVARFLMSKGYEGGLIWEVLEEFD